MKGIKTVLYALGLMAIGSGMYFGLRVDYPGGPYTEMGKYLLVLATIFFFYSVHKLKEN